MTCLAWARVGRDGRFEHKLDRVEPVCRLLALISREC